MTEQYNESEFQQLREFQIQEEWFDDPKVAELVLSLSITDVLAFYDLLRTLTPSNLSSDSCGEVCERSVDDDPDDYRIVLCGPSPLASAPKLGNHSEAPFRVLEYNNEEGVAQQAWVDLSLRREPIGRCPMGLVMHLENSTNYSDAIEVLKKIKVAKSNGKVNKLTSEIADQALAIVD